MANLYEINKAIMNCVDLETGEIVDLEALDALMMQKEEKLENIVCWIKNLLSDADAIKAEKDALADREARCRKKAERLQNYLADALNGEAFNSAKCAVSFRKSETIEVDDMKLIPAELLRVKTTVEPNKAEIKQLIKSGQAVSGCRLIQNQNIQIK